MVCFKEKAQILCRFQKREYFLSLKRVYIHPRFLSLPNFVCLHFFVYKNLKPLSGVLTYSIPLYSSILCLSFTVF